MQYIKLWQSAGTARWVYNYTISMQRLNYRFGGQFLSDNTIRKHITQMKKRPKYSWLKLVSNNITKQVVKDACSAYKKWFHSLDGSSELKVDIPKYKNKKKIKPSFYNDSNRVKVKDNLVFLEKIGWIKTSEQVPKNKKLYNPRISFDGKYWYLAIGIEVHYQEIQKNGTVSIYLGGKYPVILSTGEVYLSISQSIKIKKLKRKLTRLKRQKLRKIRMKQKNELGFRNKNIQKLDKMIQLIYRRISNIQENHWHQITSEIIKKIPK